MVYHGYFRFHSYVKLDMIDDKLESPLDASLISPINLIINMIVSIVDIFLSPSVFLVCLNNTLEISNSLSVVRKMNVKS